MPAYEVEAAVTEGTEAALRTGLGVFLNELAACAKEAEEPLKVLGQHHPNYRHTVKSAIYFESIEPLRRVSFAASEICETDEYSSRQSV